MAHDRQGMALLDDVLGHAMAHEADADESNPFLCRHCALLCTANRAGRIRLATFTASGANRKPAPVAEAACALLHGHQIVSMSSYKAGRGTLTSTGLSLGTFARYMDLVTGRRA